MKKHIVLLVLGLMALTPAHADMVSSGSEIKMITRDSLTLSDLFSDVPQTRNQIIGAAPRPGQELTLTSAQLARVAQAYGVSYTQKSPADLLVLRREGVTLSSEKIKEMIMAGLMEKGLSDDIDLTFSGSFNDMTLNVKPGTPLSLQALNYDATTGLFSAQMNVAGSPLLSGRVERLIEAPVARINFEKGDPIATPNVEMVKMKQSQIGTEKILDIDHLDHMVMRHPLAAGRIITARDVELPLSVHRGDKVTLIYRSGVMELSAQGRALEDGRTGDRVRIANVDSNKNLQGTVVASGQVVID